MNGNRVSTPLIDPASLWPATGNTAFYWQFSPLETISWELVGPQEDIVYGTQVIGLSLNAVRPCDVPGEAMLVFPSPFCSTALRFLGVLALLTSSGTTMRLYRARNLDGSATDRLLLQVFPKPCIETMELLSSFHPAAANNVRDMAAMAEQAFARLAKRA